MPKRHQKGDFTSVGTTLLSRDPFTDRVVTSKTAKRDFHVLKLVHQALYSPSWPSYLPLDTVKHLRSLRSGAATRLTIQMERGTFQDSAAKLFNVLPANIRNCSDFKVYCREVNAYLLNNICK